MHKSAPFKPCDLVHCDKVDKIMVIVCMELLQPLVSVRRSHGALNWGRTQRASRDLKMSQIFTPSRSKAAFILHHCGTNEQSQSSIRWEDYWETIAMPLRSIFSEWCTRVQNFSKLGMEEDSELWPVTFMTLGFWWSVLTLRTHQLKCFMSLFFSHPQICASVFYFFGLAHIECLIGATRRTMGSCTLL